jgi:hypothetical protein
MGIKGNEEKERGKGRRRSWEREQGGGEGKGVNYHQHSQYRNVAALADYAYFVERPIFVY